MKRSRAVTIHFAGRPLQGRAVPPGSKSITNRALLLASLAVGASRISNALKSDDTHYMAEALRQMGVKIDETDDTSFDVTGTGELLPPKGPLFLGNAGTATRFLGAAAAIVQGTMVIDGDAHMRKRPIGPLVAALQALGVQAEATNGCPPLTVHGKGRLAGGRVVIDASLSSQYCSALMMVAPCAKSGSEIILTGDGIGGRGYIDLTIDSMAAFGVDVTRLSATSWHVPATAYKATDMAVEPDASAATYLWAAEALTGGAIDTGLAAAAYTQPDARSYSLIRQFPAMPSVIDGSQMQDAVPTLAVMAAFNTTPVRFTGIANLRVKECDRIAVLAKGLTAIRPGLAREDGDDLMVMADPALGGQRPTRIDTQSDHRMAMAFALAGLRIDGVTILDADCVAKTFPRYWDTLAALGVGLEWSEYSA